VCVGNTPRDESHGKRRKNKKKRKVILSLYCHHQSSTARVYRQHEYIDSTSISSQYYSKKIEVTSVLSTKKKQSLASSIVDNNSINSNKTNTSKAYKLRVAKQSSSHNSTSKSHPIFGHRRQPKNPAQEESICRRKKRHHHPHSISHQ